MSKTGMVRAFDELGRLCIPKEIRKSIGASAGSEMQIFIEGDDIILRKPPNVCACCGSPARRMMVYGRVRICENCFSKFEPIDGGECNE